MIEHVFKADPFGRDACDSKEDDADEGRVSHCGRPEKEHMDEVHGVKVQLATALKDAAYFKASYARKLEDEKRLLEAASVTVAERDALRAENGRLREALEKIAAECEAEAGECFTPEHHMARAALASGGDRG